MNLADHLELYQKLGFSIMPITYPRGTIYEDGKKPETRLLPRDESGERSWQPLMISPANIWQINRWWENGNANLNVAVITGKVSNIAVIDLDDEDSFNRLTGAYPFLLDSLVARTGKGYHIYFRPDLFRRTCVFNLNNKTHHLKMEGGYVVAPPSRHASGKTYEFIELREPKSFNVDNIVELVESVGGVFPHSNANFDRPATWASELCQDFGEGSRNTRGAQLCGLLIRKFPYDPDLTRGLMYAWNQTYCNPPLDKRELEQLVDGELRRYGPRI